MRKDQAFRVLAGCLYFVGAAVTFIVCGSLAVLGGDTGDLIAAAIYSAFWPLAVPVLVLDALAGPLLVMLPIPFGH